MEKLKLFIAFSISIFLLNSCNKENAPDCFRSTGETVSESNALSENITKIIVYDNIGIRLINTNESEFKRTLTGGKNLLNDITFEEENGVLTIKNENKCNWVREYTSFNIIIESNSINHIYNYGSEGVIIEDFSGGSFTFEQESSLADNLISFYGNELRINMHTGAGTSDVNGEAEQLFLYSNGLSSIDASKIISPDIFANNSGRNNLITAPIDYMHAYIGGSGSILHNNPSASISTEIIGSGTLEYSDY